ncbi:MAG: efflux transporter outer membrane subunit [Gammaproteobacteria bacterium]|nr:efflux transporter outer membrane subunit [Gammaproteobacteria bacterium]
MYRIHPKIKIGLLALLSCGLSSCLLGPDFHSPKAPETDSYTAGKSPTKTVSTPAAGKGGKAQHFVVGEDIPAKWWYLFHSEALNDLIKTGIANSPNLASAQAVLRQAQETLIAQIGTSFYPALSAQMIAERESFPTTSFGINSPSRVFNLFNPSLNVSYTLDVFGGARREVEALRAQVDYEGYELIASYLTLTSNIVTLAVTVASYEEQIKATRELVKLQDDELKILKKQLQLGGASGIDVLSQETQVAQTRATLPPLEQNYQKTQHALSVLVGTLPSNNVLPHFDLNKIYLPEHLPVSLPSALVRQRPDVKASEALLHVASAQIGVATANLYPQITLTGSYGWSSNVPNAMFTSTFATWNYIGTVTQPIFNGGALRAKKREAIAAYEQAAAQYRQTVLQAFQNVADTLRALENDAKALQAQSLAERTARKNLNITLRQYRLGGVNYLSLLAAERQYQQSQISRIQAQAARYTDTVALFQALGGGWWNG